MKKKQIVKGLVIGAATLGVIGGAFAYFSAKADTVPNEFSMATGAVDQEDGLTITEEHWGDTQPNSKGVFEGGMFLQKDPTVTSNVNYDGFLVVRVSVPEVESIKHGDAAPAKANEVAAVAMDETHPGFNTADFKLLERIEHVTHADNKPYTEYYYGYLGDKENGALVSKTLRAGKVTPDLFEGIILTEFDSLLDANGAAKIDFNVDIDARLVQEVDPDTGINYTDVDTAYTKILKNAFAR